MAESQNGWRVLEARETRRWNMPGEDRGFTLQPENAGFVLTWLADWFDSNIERVDTGTWDEWGWADRDIRGSGTISNHASGTAIDINATQHPMGIRNTFSSKQQREIRTMLRERLKNSVRWGGDYNGRPDDMHFEINVGPRRLKRVARKLRRTERGRRVMKANGEKPKRRLLQGFRK